MHQDLAAGEALRAAGLWRRQAGAEEGCVVQPARPRATGPIDLLWQVDTGIDASDARGADLGAPREQS
jgi:hypothetical protein